jgi:hypothetical protein
MYPSKLASGVVALASSAFGTFIGSVMLVILWTDHDITLKILIVPISGLVALVFLAYAARCLWDFGTGRPILVMDERGITIYSMLGWHFLPWEVVKSVDIRVGQRLFVPDSIVVQPWAHKTSSRDVYIERWRLLRPARDTLNEIVAFHRDAARRGPKERGPEEPLL